MTVILSLLFALLASESPRRDAEVEPRCTLWRGTISGNDPAVSVTATLCDAGAKRVTGTLVWTSSKSGSSTRRLAGSRSGETLTLRDVALTGTPNAGWRFCRIDRYELAVEGTGRLVGTYRSSACRDDASITLVRVR